VTIFVHTYGFSVFCLNAHVLFTQITVTLIQNFNNFDFSRFGFAGESGPRCIVRTEVKCSETKQVKKVLNYSSKGELYDILVEFIHILYFRYINLVYCCCEVLLSYLETTLNLLHAFISGIFLLVQKIEE
jgi:hypothetical protein